MFNATVAAVSARVRPARPFRFCALLVAGVLYVGIALLIGYWAGSVARSRGRDFGLFMGLGTASSLLGVIPGLVVVIVAYALGSPGGRPATGAGDAPVAGSEPRSHVPGPPPVPPGTTTSREEDAGQAVRSPDGGFEYTPPPP